MKSNKIVHNHQHASDHTRLVSYGNAHNLFLASQQLKGKMEQKCNDTEKGLKFLIKTLLCCVLKHAPDDMDIQQELDHYLKSPPSTNRLHP